MSAVFIMGRLCGDLRVDPKRLRSMVLRAEINGIIASLIGVQHERDNVKKKLASLRVVTMVKSLYGIPCSAFN